MEGVELVHAMNKYDHINLSLKQGLNKLTCSIQNKFQPGKYSITIGVHHANGLTIDFVENVFDFRVLNITEGTGEGYVYDWKAGFIRMDSKWNIEN